MFEVGLLTPFGRRISHGRAVLWFPLAFVRHCCYCLSAARGERGVWRNARMSWHSLHTNNQRKIIFKGVGERIRKEKKKKERKKKAANL